jgi:hypothetical protein
MSRKDEIITRRKSCLEAARPVLVADLFPEMLEALLELLTGLSADEWNKATVCSGWSVGWHCTCWAADRQSLPA